MLHISIESLQDIPKAARMLLNQFPGARVFALFGEMGAGKTTLIKEICIQLGVKENEISSPTFALINEYHNDKGEIIFHFDFYRLEKESEAFDLGYEDYFYSGNYCFIEWPEKISSLLPESCIRVKIDLINNKRFLTASATV